MTFYVQLELCIHWKQLLQLLPYRALFRHFSREVEFVGHYVAYKYLFVALLSISSNADNIGGNKCYVNASNTVLWPNDSSFWLAHNVHFQFDQLLGGGSYNVVALFLLCCEVETLFISIPKDIDQNVRVLSFESINTFDGYEISDSSHVQPALVYDVFTNFFSKMKWG